MEGFDNKTYVLVNNDQDVKHLANYINLANYQIVTTGPYASYELDKNNLSYLSIDSFHDRENFGLEINEESNSKFIKITSYIDNYLSQMGFGGKTLEYFEYHLRSLLDTILGRILLLKEFGEKTKPEKIVYLKNSIEIPSDFSFPINDFWSPFIDVYTKEYGISSEVFNNKTGLNGTPVKAIPFEHSLLKTNLMNWVVSLKTLGVKKSIINQFRKKNLLMVGGIYEWSNTLLTLFSSGAGISFERFPYLKRNSYLEYLKAWTEMKKSLITDQDFTSLFTFHKVNIFPILSPYIDQMIASSLAYESSFTNKSTYKGVLFSYINNGAVWKKIKHLRTSGTKSFVWPHGQAGIWYNIKSEGPQLNLETDYFLAYGKGTEDTINPFTEKNGISTVPIGSSRLDTLISSNENQVGENILYVTTNYFGPTLRYYWSPVWSDLYQYEWQKKILSYLASLHKEKIIFKHHPSQKRYANFPPIIFDNPNLRVISDTSSFTDYLGASKIIIIDNLSTTLMQALTTKIPLFILLTNRETSEASVAALKKRAICSENVDELINSIDQYISHNIYPADILNDEALRFYGTYRGDGKSHLRAAEFVLRKI